MASATLGLLHSRPIETENECTKIDADDISHDDVTEYREKASTTICRLLALPAEIRNQIYHLLLTSDLIPILRCLIDRNQISSYVLDLPICPAILSTCKQIYTEASPILYSLNTFSASPTLLTKLPYLLSKDRPVLSTDVGKKIKRWVISVRLDTDPQFTEEDATAAFTGAESLDIDARQSMYKSASMDVLLLFKSIRGVKRATVRGILEPEFAEWLARCMMGDVGTPCPDYEGKDAIVIGGKAETYNIWTHGNR